MSGYRIGSRLRGMFILILGMLLAVVFDPFPYSRTVKAFTQANALYIEGTFFDYNQRREVAVKLHVTSKDAIQRVSYIMFAESPKRSLTASALAVLGGGLSSRRRATITAYHNDKTVSRVCLHASVLTIRVTHKYSYTNDVFEPLYTAIVGK
jgi:hypothetical protein